MSNEEQLKICSSLYANGQLDPHVGAAYYGPHKKAFFNVGAMFVEVLIDGNTEPICGYFTGYVNFNDKKKQVISCSAPSFLSDISGKRAPSFLLFDKLGDVTSFVAINSSRVRSIRAKSVTDYVIQAIYPQDYTAFVEFNHVDTALIARNAPKEGNCMEVATHTYTNNMNVQAFFGEQKVGESSAEEKEPEAESLFEPEFEEPVDAQKQDQGPVQFIKNIFKKK